MTSALGLADTSSPAESSPDRGFGVLAPVSGEEVVDDTCAVVGGYRAQAGSRECERSDKLAQFMLQVEVVEFGAGVGACGLWVVVIVGNGVIEVVSVFVEFEVAVPHLRPAGW